jgi:hypothetical protein
MKGVAEHVQILYEIAMSIDTGLELEEMLQKSLTAFVEKLDCSAGGVYRLRKEAERGLSFTSVCSIPQDINENEAYQEALQSVPGLFVDEQHAADYCKRLPLSGRCSGGFFYIIELPAFGAMVLIKNGESLDPVLIESLTPVVSKLAAACNACLRNEELKKAYLEVAERNRKLGEKAVHLEMSQEVLLNAMEDMKRTEDKLHRLSSAVEQSPSMVVITDTRGNIEYVNRKFTQLTGYALEDILGTNIAELGKLSSEEYEWLQDAITSGRVKHGEFRKKKNGKFYWEYTTIFPVRDRDGVITHFIKVTTDITKRKRVEEELRLLQKINNAVNSSIPLDAVLQMIVDSVREFFDCVACDILLLEKNRNELIYAALSIDLNLLRRIERLTGLNIRGLRIPLYKGSCFTKVVETGEVLTTDNVVKFFENFTEDKKLKSFAVPIALISGFKHVIRAPLIAKGEVIGVLGVATRRSVSEEDAEVLGRLASQVALVIKKGQAEEALRESEDRCKQIFLQNEDGIIIFKSGTCEIVDVNPAAVELFGYTKQELIKHGPLFIAPEESKRFRQAIKDSDLEKKGLRIDEETCIRKDGTKVVVSIRGKVIRLQQSDVLYCSFRDITEKIRMEEETKLRQAQLIQANKMTALGTLVSGVAHEINNPNNFIMFNSSLLSEVWKDAVRILDEYSRENGEFFLGGLPFSEMREVIPRLLSGITDGSRRIKSIVDNLKDFVRQDKSGLDGKVDINKVVTASALILSNQIKKHTDNFHLNCGENLPLVKGSAQQLEQVVINLILNSLQALPDRKRAIWVSTFFDAESDSVVIEVKDEGVGMTADVLERITEPFFTTKLDAGGTGLGLSISYSIIKNHNASIQFESEPGKGTTAIVRLPATEFKVKGS